MNKTINPVKTENPSIEDRLKKLENRLNEMVKIYHAEMIKNQRIHSDVIMIGSTIDTLMSLLQGHCTESDKLPDIGLCNLCGMVDTHCQGCPGGENS